MSWTDFSQYNQVDTGTTTPLSSISNSNNNRNLVQDLNTKLINSVNALSSFGQLGSTPVSANPSQQNYYTSAPSSVSSDSLGEYQKKQSNNNKMGTQIDCYFANDESSQVSSNFWNLNQNQAQQLQEKFSPTANCGPSFTPADQPAERQTLSRNTLEEETFLQNQANVSLSDDLWSTNNHQTSGTGFNGPMTGAFSSNNISAEQSLFDLMKYGYTGDKFSQQTGGFYGADSNRFIPDTNNIMNNTHFNNNGSNNTNVQNAGLSYTASTTPVPSTPLSNTSPKQMNFPNSNGNFAPQQAQAQDQLFQQQLLQQQLQQQQLQGLQEYQGQQVGGVQSSNLLQSYQQQQLYLEQLQQQHQQLLQNPLIIQQQAQLVSQQLQQLQKQLQLQKQQIEATTQQLSSVNGSTKVDALTEENLIKLQQAPKDVSSNGQVAVSTGSSTGDKSAVNTELYKTELCSTFSKTGTCPYGNKCQFAHGQNELKVVNRGSKYRSKPCANWTKTGSCRYGNRCCFRHCK